MPKKQTMKVVFIIIKAESVGQLNTMKQILIQVRGREKRKILKQKKKENNTYKILCTKNKIHCTLNIMVFL